MDKEQTQYKIKKLIMIYEKRLGNVNEAFKRLDEGIDDPQTLYAEESLISEFIEDLQEIYNELDQ